MTQIFNMPLYGTKKFYHFFDGTMTSFLIVLPAILFVKKLQRIL